MNLVILLQAKKVEKHLKKHSLRGFEYTNDDNPFGDANITDRFVWGKKIEKEIEQGKSVRELAARAEQKRQNERIEEIEKVKRRREQREAERAAITEDLEMMQRERARAEAVDLERKEDEFHLEQAKVRAQKRLAAGRPKAIDVITNNLFLLDGFDSTAEEPSGFISGLNLFQLQELEKDVEEYSVLDAMNHDHEIFWQALKELTNHELAEAIKQEEIDKARVRGLPPPEKYQIREAGWHPSLDADVAEMLNGKTLSELNRLEDGILDQLDSGAAADPDYWTAVLRRLKLYKSRAILREFHANLVEQELDKLRRGLQVPTAHVSAAERAVQAKKEAARVKEEMDSMHNEHSDGKDLNEIKEEEPEAHEIKMENPEEIDLGEESEEEDLEALAIKEPETTVKLEETTHRKEKMDLLDRGEPQSWSNMDEEERMDACSRPSLSPKPLPPEYAVGQNVIPEDDDLKLMQLLREKALIEHQKSLSHAANVAAASGAARINQAEAVYKQVIENPDEAGALVGSSNPLLKYITTAQETSKETDMNERLIAVAARSMGQEEGDGAFGGEVDIRSQVYWWHEKYKPRKPKYFNRIHTGFDWTKYNRAHYDIDNPPPKMVQGYKFNIFFPDLIDPSTAPKYSLEKDPESSDGSTCLIRFSGGPPYEDIAFRIVNKQWNTDPKRGFKCIFDRGILQLYFSFKRTFYKR